MKLRHTISEPRRLPAATEVVSTEQGELHNRFDLLSELEPQEVEALERKIDRLRNVILLRYKEDITDIYEMASLAQIVVLFPEKREELSRDEQLLFCVKRMLRRLKNEKQGSKRRVYLSRLSSACLLFPEYRQEFKYGDQEFADYSTQIDNLLGGTEYSKYNLLKHSADRMLAFPERGIDCRLPDDLFNELLAYVQAERGRDLRVYMEVAAWLKLLYPERASALHIGDADLKDMTINMQRARMEDAFMPNRVFSIAVLAADEARVTEHGLELINRSEISRPTSLPERNIA